MQKQITMSFEEYDFLRKENENLRKENERNAYRLTIYNGCNVYVEYYDNKDKMLIEINKRISESQGKLFSDINKLNYRLSYIENSWYYKIFGRFTKHKESF